MPDQILDCCEPMRLAHQGGTDNEEYGALVYDATLVPQHGIPHNYPHIGSSDLQPINFCPWCGKRARQPAPDMCTVCRSNPVDVDSGFDTCTACQRGV